MGDPKLGQNSSEGKFNPLVPDEIRAKLKAMFGGEAGEGTVATKIAGGSGEVKKPDKIPKPKNEKLSKEELLRRQRLGASRVSETAMAEKRGAHKDASNRWVFEGTSEAILDRARQEMEKNLASRAPTGEGEGEKDREIPTPIEPATEPKIDKFRADNPKLWDDLHGMYKKNYLFYRRGKKISPESVSETLLLESKVRDSLKSAGENSGEVDRLQDKIKMYLRSISAEEISKLEEAWKKYNEEKRKSNPREHPLPTAVPENLSVEDSEAAALAARSDADKPIRDVLEELGAELKSKITEVRAEVGLSPLDERDDFGHEEIPVARPAIPEIPGGGREEPERDDPTKEKAEKLAELRKRFLLRKAEEEADLAYKKNGRVKPLDEREEQRWFRGKFLPIYLESQWEDLELPAEEREAFIEALLNEFFLDDGTPKPGESPEEKLHATREAFVKSEKNFEKYMGIVGGVRAWFGGRAMAKDEYAKNRESYELARAEVVADDIQKFLGEETTLADGRIKTELEKKKGFGEKFSDAWKWLGDQNLEKAGWRPEGKIGRIVARGLNARLAIGVGLLGVSWLAPPVAFYALGVRQGMAGTGGAMFSSEWLLRKEEVRRTTVSEKELVSMETIDVQRKISDMVIGLRMQGKLTSESKDYKRLMSHYETLLKGDYERASDVAIFIKEQSAKVLENFSLAQEEYIAIRGARRSFSLIAGIGSAVGATSILRWLYGANEAVSAAGAVTSSGTPGITPQEVETAIRAEHEIPATAGAEGMTPADLETAVRAEHEILTEVSPNQVQAHLQEIQQKAAESAASIAAGEIIPKSFEVVVQPGEGPIHEARKVIAEYIAVSGDEKLKGLTKAQRIFAEEKLYRAVKDSLPKWEVGAKVSFPRDAVEKVLDGLKNQTPDQIAALDKNLSPFVDKVKWQRYEVSVNGDKPWEWDEGIKKISKVAARAGESDLTDLPEQTPRGRLAGILTREESSYIPDRQYSEETSLGDTLSELEVSGDEAKLQEIVLGAEPAEATETSSTLAEVVVAPDAPPVAEAVWDAGGEKVAYFISRLDPNEYRAIKGLKISEMLKKTFWGATDETRWPSFLSPNHVDLMRKLKFRDAIASIISSTPESEHESISKLTIKQFIERFYLHRR